MIKAGETLFYGKGGDTNEDIAFWRGLVEERDKLIRRAAELLSSVTGDEDACQDVEPSWYHRRSEWYRDAGI